MNLFFQKILHELVTMYSLQNPTLKVPNQATSSFDANWFVESDCFVFNLCGEITTQSKLLLYRVITTLSNPQGG
jgi:hypothetical protein